MRLAARGRTVVFLTVLTAILAILATMPEDACDTATSVTYWDACR